MTIIIWGIGNMSCLIEEYIKHDHMSIIMQKMREGGM